MSVKQILRDIAPEFADLDDELIDRIIQQAEIEVDKKQFKQAGDKAIALQTAHILTIRERKGMAGNITSQKEGDLAMSFAQSDYSSLYAEELAKLKRSFIANPLVS